MSYRLLESGNRPSVDVGDGTEARLALEALVDSARLRNIVLALARFTSDRSEKLNQQDPAIAGFAVRERFSGAAQRLIHFGNPVRRSVPRCAAPRRPNASARNWPARLNVG
jgi:hypothetical protein